MYTYIGVVVYTYIKYIQYIHLYLHTDRHTDVGTTGLNTHLQTRMYKGPYPYKHM